MSELGELPAQRRLGGPLGPGRTVESNFHGEKQSNKTRTSTTDPDAKLYKKGSGQGSRLAYMGHLLIENRIGLIVDAE